MKYQRVISLTALLSFIILTISSGVLYFLPDRRYTSWGDWSFLGLDKAQWDNIHITIGILFIVVIIWHIYYNWKPIKTYLKVKKDLKIFTKEFNFSLLIVTIFMIGTITMTFPIKIFVNLGNGIKSKNAYSMPNPPFEYAQEARFKDFCTILNIDTNSALKKLKNSNIKVVSKSQKIMDIAKSNHTSSQKIYEIIKSNKTSSLPNSLPIGLAQRTLATLNSEYGLNISKAISYLKNQGIEINKDSKFKRVTNRYNLHPAELYAMLLASQKL